MFTLRAEILGIRSLDFQGFVNYLVRTLRILFLHENSPVSVCRRKVRIGTSLKVLCMTRDACLIQCSLGNRCINCCVKAPPDRKAVIWLLL